MTTLVEFVKSAALLIGGAFVLGCIVVAVFAPVYLFAIMVGLT